MALPRPRTWLLPDHEGFSSWATSTFGSDDPNPDGEDGIRLFDHQRFVRDYMRPDSPYGGLVLYHGVGFGKTCAAVAVMRGVLSTTTAAFSRIFVLLPASTRSNFVAEIRRCGGMELGGEVGVWWHKNRDQWIPSSSRTRGSRSFVELDAQDRIEVRAVIDAQISRHVEFINYNGLTSASVDALCDDSRPNPFEGALIVIDEAHNFVSSSSRGRLVSRIYTRLMDARMRKVLLLTGTPFKNSALELPLLINLAAGYVRVVDVTIPVTSGQTDVEKRAEKAAMSCLCVNRTSIEYVGSVLRLTSSLVSPLHLRVSVNSPFVAAQVSPEPRTDEEDVRSLVSALKTHGIPSVTSRQHVRTRRITVLPTGDAFIRHHISSKTGKITNIDVLVRRIAGYTSFFEAHDASLFPTLRRPFGFLRLAMSTRQFEIYKLVRERERVAERAADVRERSGAGRRRHASPSPADLGGAFEDNDGDDGNASYRSASRMACNFVFPEGISRPVRRDYAGPGANAAYLDDLNRAVSSLTPDHVALEPKGNLSRYSPKFAAIVTALRDRTGPMLIYSQFRTAEGIGVLSRCLDVNEFDRVRVRRIDGSWTWVITGSGISESPRYAVFESDDDPEARALLLAAFNSDGARIPSDLATSMRGALGPDVFSRGNSRGAWIKALMITTAGAEGINLRNVREVHVMEPFWHGIRLDQVIGRAVRAGSHSDLPPRERTVTVTQYVSTFTEAQATEPTIRNIDGGITSDEFALRVSTRKRAIVHQMLDVMRRASVDCAYHHTKHVDVGVDLRCDTTASSYAIDPDDDHRGVRHVRKTLQLVRVAGMLFYRDPGTGLLYDVDMYRSKGVLVRVDPPRAAVHRPKTLKTMRPIARASRSAKDTPMAT